MDEDGVQGPVDGPASADGVDTRMDSSEADAGSRKGDSGADIDMDGGDQEKTKEESL